LKFNTCQTQQRSPRGLRCGFRSPRHHCNIPLIINMPTAWQRLLLNQVFAKASNFIRAASVISKNGDYFKLFWILHSLSQFEVLIPHHTYFNNFAEINNLERKSFGRKFYSLSLYRTYWNKILLYGILLIVRFWSLLFL